MKGIATVNSKVRTEVKWILGVIAFMLICEGIACIKSNM